MRTSFCLAIAFALLIHVTPQAQPTPAEQPAAFQSMAVPSHGSLLLGVFYLAAGNQPHPTAVLFHGYPGFEQNLDIAQTLRANGWNVLALHYRGSWGVKGDFSFHHAIEDADTEVQFVLAPETVQKYRIDPSRVIVIGHSMGGYMAASAAAHNPAIAGAVLISAWNIGAGFKNRHKGPSGPTTLESEARSLAEDNDLLPLAGTTGLKLAQEILDHQDDLNFINLAPAIAPRPVFVITASEGLAPADHQLVEALQKSGDTRVIERHWDTDHSYSGQRAELSAAILAWTHDILPK
ncbi:MAG TPA: alpha/beta fold hydrolase [Terracidiphilus sp.]|jgi:pimeloyl-ACP methyl ester carboxylesterase|nr:alpha/beta fold hydrolase [Terracidiphilus sp.]